MFPIILLTIVYTCSYADAVVFCGDFNSRIGNNLDYIPDIDPVTERLAIDISKNSHGSSFLEFLKEAKLCVLNGRVTKEFDNFTFSSTRGNSVVDYFIVPLTT